MEVSEHLLCLFSAHVEERDGSSVVTIPEQELRLGEIDDGETYRVALLSGTENGDGSSTKSSEDSTARRNAPTPPVREGETREVEIEDIGEQGDGITRVERGFVVIVPDTELGERVTVEISDVRQNVAFADVIERETHFH